MDIKVGDRVVWLGDESATSGVVTAILNADVPFPVVVQWPDFLDEEHYGADELEVIS